MLCVMAAYVPSIKYIAMVILYNVKTDDGSMFSYIRKITFNVTKKQDDL